jgi:hypothetical protein
LHGELTEPDTDRAQQDGAQGVERCVVVHETPLMRGLL